MNPRVIVAGGGTGGHLYPGIAVVEELRRRLPGVEVTWVGTARGLEARVLPAMGERVEWLDVEPLVGRDLRGLVHGVGRLPGAIARARSLLRAHEAGLVIGLGGYAAGPVMMAAILSRVPCALLEQNATVGLTNRLVAPLVGRAYVSFAETARVFPSSRVRVVGNPVRRAFVHAARRVTADPEGFEARARRLVVLGGSQGSRTLNRIVPEALARLRLAERGLTVLHQAGSAMRDEVAEAYRRLGIPADVVAYVDDVAALYATAAVVVARAGATTIAELCAVGRPAVYVPYPHAAGDHQLHNARALEAAGAALCLPETGLDAARLAERLGALLDDPARRRAMAEAARRLGRPQAAADVVDDLVGWLGWPARGPVERSSLPARDREGPTRDEPDSGPTSSLRRTRHAYVPRRRSEGLDGPAVARSSRRPLLPVLES
ncbi:MAG: undecaprenyldiphospho-muramoylpentapeptide beta-N-acetylglucosaminyltransferase [Myxococcota bacterium]|nr:undecaprenyldiphospho-muramoylpentapeptide beta-N-acetylglucosaminyltransferase [Myxococcota bacterium]MDW8362538.1 undecaprenyldiphospho-muramoylpentapeptide beta-N-acetylglucosaminyltransferase [Myxococcales bacterium]